MSVMRNCQQFRSILFTRQLLVCISKQIFVRVKAVVEESKLSNIEEISGSDNGEHCHSTKIEVIISSTTASSVTILDKKKLIH